ncbi:hypothetical protein BDA99DRAFT_532225 [Phascolomyces articulosus]|uniref:Uncharacterized protein n=1 Tax=Phascolomyces articulosus TaxID=60185 RepID=A0AAD5KX59_9FUNG|nr:hypothetical protein BDA99DRAFT_532225 [Phascolomyces articulosus]
MYITYETAQWANDVKETMSRTTTNCLKVFLVSYSNQNLCQPNLLVYLISKSWMILKSTKVDKEEKHREIRNLYRIFSNAYCTVALVPEFRYLSYDEDKARISSLLYQKDMLQQHEWFKSL